MAKLKLVQPRLAPRLARRFAPTIIQEVRSVYDFLVPITTEELQPRHIETPTIYCVIHVDGIRYYALYAVFHRFDWSALPWPFKSLDEHQFDLEGILRVFDINTGLHLWCASIFHREILFQERADPGLAFRIEPAGHGILPPKQVMAGKGSLDRAHMAVRYPFADGCGDIRPIDRHSWEQDYQQLFNAHGVHCPWQWNDHRIRDKYGPESDGLIYWDPARLFELAGQLAII